jgi:hypothetical protein
VYGAITLYCRPFQDRSTNTSVITDWLAPVRSPLLRGSRLISIPPGTEMFHFPGFASTTLWIQVGILLTQWVSPFGHRRLNAFCQLPVAFRRLTRPSSPSIAKASTVCAYSLDLITPRSLELYDALNSRVSDADTYYLLL